MVEQLEQAISYIETGRIFKALEILRSVLAKLKEGDDELVA